MIVWLNGTHGVGKTTTARIVQGLLPGSHVLDAEKVGETLMDVSPGLPPTDDFQHWDPWRPLVVETAWRVQAYAGGVLVMPMTVLVEAYWREISGGLAARGVALRHVVLHADESALRSRIAGEHPVPSPFRLSRLEPYAEAARTWLHRDADLVVDTTDLAPPEVGRRVVEGITTG